jgi:peroxiredoxin
MKRSVSLLASAAVMALAAAIAQASVSVGQSAPDFHVKDTSGKDQSLAAYKGKYVVLEWVNPDCPFVKKHYDSANMQSTQKAAEAKGAVWLSVSTNGKAAPELAAWVKEQKASPTATLLDGDGKLGKAYGARTTPHMYVINPEGKLVYAGAIDSKATANKSDIQGATNYVTVALTESMSCKAVSKATTEPYGCSVKY